ncbi:Killer toxin subunits alpha/beta 6 [Colletotrichum musicola]|uniref:Killer toxin subunits alpha/beta 6 n=1 Tax=Colletotrichum musicola TaxID=2175873 RepID=A0A8H6IW20_9PEZI|nr:Killer toxin subunits alpha/beta 6 [Colletotrichum musicola]
MIVFRLSKAVASVLCPSSGFIAQKCGISQDTFVSYNTGPNFCDSLRVGQAVCYSSGNLPDLRPKRKPDGSCFDYVVQTDDWCDSIAAFHGLTLDELKVLNENTWGFSGCENLSAGVELCLSKGSPPMPVPISNAVCGPQKPNTPAPSYRSPENLAKLNPCPLEACCNNWGQCGTTKEFCEAPPRGSKVGTMPGCIQNCGIDVFENSEPAILVYDNDRGAESMSAEEKKKSITKRRGLNVGGVFDRVVEVEDWRTMNCEHPAIRNTLQPAKRRWESIGADEAWKELVEAWEKGESRLDFMRERTALRLNYGFCIADILGKFMRANYLNAAEGARDGLEQAVFKEAFCESKTDEAIVLPILNNLLSVGFTSGLASVFGHTITFGASTARNFIGIISEGKMTPGCEKDAEVCNNGRGILSATEMRRMWDTAVYGYLIPQIWKLEGVNPVVIMTDAKCDDVGVGAGLDGYIRPEHAEWARGCLGDKLSYLLSPSARAMDQNTAGSVWSPPWSQKHQGRQLGGSQTPPNGRFATTVIRKEGVNDPAYKSKGNYDLMWDVIGQGESMVRTPGLVDIPAPGDVNELIPMAS